MPELKWQPADEEGVVAFLVGEKSFSEERVRKQVQKMNASRSKASQGVPPASCLPCLPPSRLQPLEVWSAGRPSMACAGSRQHSC